MYNKKIENRVKSQDQMLSQFAKAIILLLASCFFTLPANAQCAMCRAAIESEGNGAKAEAVNDGIVYLMVIPYILVGGIGFAVYQMNKKKKTI